MGAAVAPGGGADELSVVCDWSAGIALARVFASDVKDSSAEHSLKNFAAVVASIVADAVRDDVDIDAVELARVVGAGSGGVAPAADADLGAVGHPLVVLVRRKRDWNDIVVDDERALEKENGDVVDQSSRVVVRVATESIDLNQESKYRSK